MSTGVETTVCIAWLERKYTVCASRWRFRWLCNCVCRFQCNYPSCHLQFACDFLCLSTSGCPNIFENELHLSKNPAKHRTLEPRAKQVYNTMSIHGRSQEGLPIMHTRNIVCYYELSPYTHMAATPYAPGSSHNLLSDRPHHESDLMWLYSIVGCSVARSVGTPWVLHSNATDIDTL